MRTIIGLNKNWTFTPEAMADEKPSASRVDLPFFHSIDTMPSGTFSNSWTAGEEHEGKTVYLEFSQISGTAEVYSGDRLLSTHSSGTCRFRVQLTLDAKMGESYDVSVRVTPSPRKDGLFSFAGVNLLVVDSSHFNMTDLGNGLKVDTVCTAEKCELSVKTEIIRPNNYDVVSYTVYGKKGEVITSKTCKPTSPDTKLSFSDPELWDGQSGAYTYTLEAKLLRDSQCLDEVSTVFGIRDTVLGQDGFLYLNGFKLPLSGVVLTDCAAIRSDIENLKKLDGNLLMSSILPSKTNLLSVCDETGMFFWFALPITNNIEKDKEHLKEFITLYRNHPSLSAVVFATGSDNSYFNELSSYLHELAPSVMSVLQKNIDDAEGEIPEKAKIVLLTVPCTSDPESFITFNGRFSFLQEAYPEKCIAILPESPDKADKTPEELGEWHIRMWNTFCRQRIVAYFGGILSDGKAINSKRGLSSNDRNQLYDIFWYYKSQFSAKGFIKICELDAYETLDKFIDIKCITNCQNIRILVNGRNKKYKPEKITDGVYVFRQLKLKRDMNLIEVSAGEECDSIEIIRI